MQQEPSLQFTIRNDSVNTAMLELNAKLGFKRVGAEIRFVKPLKPNAVV